MAGGGDIARVDESGAGHLSGRKFLRRLRWLIFHAWNIPPVFGLGFILLIGVLQPSQVIGILTTPLEPAYILGWLAFSVWFLPRQMRPLADWLDGRADSDLAAALRAVRRFPLVFWTTFLIYLAVAPASVIVAAEIYTGFVATPYDWFRIELVALIVSIIVGLPIFFLIFDLFGRALGAMNLARPIVTIRTKVFLIGALVPLLINTMLVQYYWTRTGYFTVETFGVWLLLEALAIGGSLIFAHSFGQSLSPLQSLTGASLPLPEARIAALRARSTDEIGVITADYRSLLEEQRAQQQLLEVNNSLLRIAATTFESQVGMMVTDSSGVILRINQAFTEITGYTADEALGQTPRLLKSGRHNADFYREMWETINRTGQWQGEVWDRRKTGEVFPKCLTISEVRDGHGAVTHYVGTHQDITERKQAEARINELAFYDPLTSLPNRTLLLDRLKQAMTASSRSGSYGALLLIDLDNFKTINDTLGHDTGNELLKQVAQRLTMCVRDGDTVARLGGDEFVVMLADLSTHDKDAATQTEAVGEKILAALNQPYQLKTVSYHSTPSIGVILFDGLQTELDDLLKQADLAMYKSKEAGRNALHFFDPEMEIVVLKRAALERDLREAIAGEQFLLHYQAQMAGSRLTGAEVLLRWQHPQRGLVSPADFIPLAEETGLILPMGHWVMENTCAQLAAWASQPEMAHLTVAVNVSARQFRHKDFVEQVMATLDHTGANPQRLKLELTESLLVANVEEVIEKMLALKARGVGFSLDDFGTGYSSLSYLKRLPLDQLKIDQSFVRDVLTDPNDAAIARTVVALAQSLGLGVIAEGVETEAQRDILASFGCHAYQGYFYSRPLPLAGFEEFARRA